MKTLLKLIFPCCLILFSASIFAQGKLDELLKERKELYKEFEFYEAQKSSFWGTKSKKDLSNIIETLKAIIVKDTEIIHQINLQHTQKSVKSITKNQVSQEWLAQLENETNRLEMLLKKTKFDYNQLLEENEELKAKNDTNNTVLFILSFIICAMLFYLVKLRQSLKLREMSEDMFQDNTSVSKHSNQPHLHVERRIEIGS